MESVFDRDELMQYVMVAENERFDYATVYYNQTQDVHPPLYLLFSAHSLLAVPRKLYKVDGHWLKFRLSWMYVGCNVCSGTRTAA